MTRLPAPARRPPAVVAQLMATNFPASRFLSADGAQELLAELARGEIAGGSVYDALVGAAAREHQLPLATKTGVRSRRTACSASTSRSTSA